MSFADFDNNSLSGNNIKKLLTTNDPSIVLEWKVDTSAQPLVNKKRYRFGGYQYTYPTLSKTGSTTSPGVNKVERIEYESKHFSYRHTVTIRKK